jgi:GLPGLI family protein
MENDANPNLMNAIAASSANGIFYTNLQECVNFRQEKSLNGNFYCIKNNLKDWKITKETKVIGNYKCYKATKKVLLNGRKLIEVVAWFTPEIPFSYGLKGYGGLPGLIIALNERGFYFYVNKIKFLKKPPHIKKPEKGKLVTQQEYINLLRPKY